MPVIVLFGGDGSEHRVSVASAQNVSRELPEASLWYWTTSGRVERVSREALTTFERPFERDFVAEPEKSWNDIRSAVSDERAAADAVFFLALHGGSGENGTLQEILESAGRPFTGSGSAASRLAFDKLLARERVKARGVTVAEARRLTRDTATHEALGRLFETHGKLVVKPVADGSSHGLRFVETERDLDETLREVSAPGAPEYFAEAFVAGRELTVGVLENEGKLAALPCSEVRLEEGRTFDYEGKYLGRGTVELTPAPVSEDLARAAQDVALKAHEAVGCDGYSRTDVILSDEGPVFLEINTLPGLTAASFIPQQLEAAGISMATFLSGQLDLARERAQRRSGSG